MPTSSSTILTKNANCEQAPGFHYLLHLVAQWKGMVITMKKTTSILLAIAIVISTFSSCFVAYAVEIEENTAEQNAAYGLTKALGINADVNEGFISRARFAELLVKALREENNKSEKKYYTDIAQESPINYLTDLGIIKYTNTDKYYPDENITVGEAVYSIINVLYHFSEPERKRIKDYEYRTYARKIGLISNYKDDELLTEGQCICLLYNMLICDSYTFGSIILDEGEYYFSENKKTNTLLEGLYDIKGISGRVTANSYASIYEDKQPTDSGNIRIGDVEYSCDKFTEYKMFGCNVLCFYKTETREVVYIGLKNEENVVEVNSEDIFEGSYEKVTYEKDNKTKRIKLKAPLVTVNGIPDFNMGNREIEKILKAKNTTFKFILDDDGNYCDLIIAETLESGEIKSISDDRKYAIVDFYGKTKKVSFDDSKCFALALDNDGNVISDADFKVGNYVSCVAAESEKFLLVYRCDKTLTGKINKLTNQDGVTIAEIENEQYFIDTNMYISQPPVVGETYIFYIDRCKRIFKAIKNSNDGLKVAYIYARGTEDGLDKEYKYKFYTEDKQHITAKMKSKLKLNGESVSDEYADSIIAPSGTLIKQLVRIRVNNDNIITQIDTGSTDAEEKYNRLTVLGKMNKRGIEKYSESGHFFIRPADDESGVIGYPCSTKTVVFDVPYNDRAEEDDFNISTASAWFVDGAKREMEIYDLNNDGFADYILYEYNSEDNKCKVGKNIVYMVNDVYQTLEDDEICIGIRVVSANNTYNLILASNLYICDVDSENYVFMQNTDDIIKKISPGDLIQVNGDAASKSEYVKIIYRYRDDKVCWDDDYSFQSPSSWLSAESADDRLKCTYGICKEIKMTADKLSTYAFVADKMTGEVKEVAIIPENVTMFDASRRSDQAYIARKSDLIGSDIAGDNASRIFKVTQRRDADYYYFFYSGKR